MFTTAHLSSGGWYLNCHITFTHSSKVEYQKSFEGLGAIDLDVDEFARLNERQKKRAIARMEYNDKKKEA